MITAGLVTYRIYGQPKIHKPAALKCIKPAFSLRLNKSPRKSQVYINAILDAGQKTGHRKGGLTVSLERADRQTEIDRFRTSRFRREWADDIEKHTTKGVLYVVEIKNVDGRVTRQIVDVSEVGIYP